jgi:hypothetical protein
LHGLVGGNVTVVVVVDELMTKGLAENGGNRQHEQDTNGRFLSHSKTSGMLLYPVYRQPSTLGIGVEWNTISG